MFKMQVDRSILSKYCKHAQEMPTAVQEVTSIHGKGIDISF